MLVALWPPWQPQCCCCCWAPLLFCCLWVRSDGHCNVVKCKSIVWQVCTCICVGEREVRDQALFHPFFDEIFFFFLMPRDMIYYITWIGEKQNNLYSERTVKTTFLKICISLSMQHAGIAKLLSSHRTPVCLYVNHKIRHWMMLCCLEHQQMHPSIWVDVSEDNSTVHFLCRSVYGRYNKMRGPTLYRSH